ncbi:hypothetical protein NDU88_004042 [Pleurodeles waltl]|uniref:Uncharacterized protein n=1 Tax=Pleurodeles waltl TaxID=8319 RepID=A0AAV7T6L4_PLEWA|nr:hypothetical protein NDU88_004042 [Pleurodeles waltl]
MQKHAAGRSMCFVTPSTRKHSPNHSRAVRPHQTMLQETTDPHASTMSFAERGKDGTRGTATSGVEEDAPPPSAMPRWREKAKRERRELPRRATRIEIGCASPSNCRDWEQLLEPA